MLRISRCALIFSFVLNTLPVPVKADVRPEPAYATEAVVPPELFLHRVIHDALKEREWIAYLALGMMGTVIIDEEAQQTPQPQREWQAQLQAVGAGMRKLGLQIRPRDLWSYFERPRQGPHRPGSLAMNAEDLIRLLPPMPAGTEVKVIANQDRSLNIQAVSPALGNQYLDLELELHGQGTPDDPYTVHLQHGSVGGLEIRTHLQRLGIPFTKTPSEQFLDDLIGWLESLPWNGPAYLMIDEIKNNRSAVIFLNRRFVIDPRTRDRLIRPLNRALPEHPAFVQMERQHTFYSRIKKIAERVQAAQDPYPLALWRLDIQGWEAGEIEAARNTLYYVWLQHPEISRYGTPNVWIARTLDVFVPNEHFIPAVEAVLKLVEPPGPVQHLLGLLTAGSLITRHIRRNGLHDFEGSGWLDLDAWALIVSRYLEAFIQAEDMLYRTPAKTRDVAAMPHTTTLWWIFMRGLAEIADFRLSDSEIEIVNDGGAAAEARDHFGSVEAAQRAYAVRALPKNPVFREKAIRLLHSLPALRDGFHTRGFRELGRDADIKIGDFSRELVQFVESPTRFFEEPFFNLLLKPEHGGPTYNDFPNPLYRLKHGDPLDHLNAALHAA